MHYAIRRESRRFLVALFVFAFGSLSTPSEGAVVSVIGGFTSFSSNVYGTTQYLPVDALYTTLNGTQVCPVAGCANNGLAVVDFGVPVDHLTFQISDTDVAAGITYVWDQNRVAFDPAENQVVNGFGPDNKFLLGRFTFENGLWSDTTAYFGYELEVVSDDPALAGESYVYTGTVVMQATPNAAGNSAEQNADFVYLLDDPEAGSLRAYELLNSPTGTNIASVDIYGYLGSLHVAEFRNPVGGFIDTSVTTALAAPEPASWSLMILAFLLASPFLYRRKADRT